MTARTMRGTEATKQAARLRLVLALPMSVPGLFMAVLYIGGGSWLGLLLAVPPLRLLWIGGADAISLFKGTFHARPRFYWLALGSVLPFVVWWASFL